jgi:hypothetical protein
VETPRVTFLEIMLWKGHLSSFSNDTLYPTLPDSWAQPARLVQPEGPHPFRWPSCPVLLFPPAPPRGPHMHVRRKEATGIWKRVDGHYGNGTGATWAPVTGLGPDPAVRSSPRRPGSRWSLYAQNFLVFLRKNAQNLCRHNCVNRCLKGCPLRTLAPTFAENFVARY